MILAFKKERPQKCLQNSLVEATLLFPGVDSKDFILMLQGFEAIEVKHVHPSMRYKQTTQTEKIKAKQFLFEVCSYKVHLWRFRLCIPFCSRRVVNHGFRKPQAQTLHQHTTSLKHVPLYKIQFTAPSFPYSKNISRSTFATSQSLHQKRWTSKKTRCRRSVSTKFRPHSLIHLWSAILTLYLALSVLQNLNKNSRKQLEAILSDVWNRVRSRFPLLSGVSCQLACKRWDCIYSQKLLPAASRYIYIVGV